MKASLKRSILHALRLVGVFHLARRLTRRRLRILCYHGISVGDQHAFEDVLFMRSETFRRRMRLLKKWAFPILPLRQAVDGLAANSLPADATSITIDDGWRTTFSHQIPILTEVGYPATVYLTTYYLEKNTEIFNVFVRYAFWKTRSRILDLAILDPALSGTFDLNNTADRSSALDQVLARGEALNAKLRQTLAAELAAQLGLDFQKIQRSRMFRFVSPEELRACQGRGIELQLHTHRHQLSTVDRKKAESEIQENRASLKRMGVPAPLDLFCFPNGTHDPRQGGWLRELGIHNAATCEPGFNDRRTNRYFLSRFLDRESISDIEFQAELFGVFELLRNGIRRLDPTSRFARGA